MASVDPFVIRWPLKWSSDPEIRPVIDYLNRFLHDLWIRSGGGDDAVGKDDVFKSDTSVIEEQVASLSNSLAMVEGVPSEIDDIRTQILLLSSAINEAAERINPFSSETTPSGDVFVEMATGATTLTTTGLEQYVICNNTANGTVTLNANPADGEFVHIKRMDAQITVSGSVNIDGAASYVMTNQYDGLKFVYSAITAQWGRY